MKKNYVRPQICGERFVSNEYVAACYHGVCNISGYVFTDVNNNGVYDAEIDTYKYYNKACNADYWVEGDSTTLPQKNAFVFQSITWDTGDLWNPRDDKWVGVGEPVQVWNFDDHHTTTSMDLQNRPNHS